jgi:hypothetical protein
LGLATLPAPRTARRALDLAVYGEATRQAIYDFVLGEYFTRKKVRGVDSDPLYDPVESELQVLFLFGRWLVTYRTLGEQVRLPECARRVLLLVAQDERGRLALREI